MSENSMTNQEKKEVLVKASSALSSMGWTQGFSARTAKGAPVSPGSSRAASVCAVGALYLAVYALTDLDERKAKDLVTAQKKVGEAGQVLLQHLGALPYYSITTWNDAAGRTKAEVESVFKKAVDSLRNTPEDEPFELKA